MKLKIILASLLYITYIASMEQNGLKNLLLQPASLTFQAAWRAVANGDNLELTGADHIVELGNKIKNILQADISAEEKKLFINLISDPEFSAKQIQSNFPDLVDIYIGQHKQLKSRQQFLNSMILGDDSDSINLFMEESIYNNSTLFKLLINAGADVNAQDHKQQTPLIKATLYNRKNLVQMLIESNAKIDLQDKDKNTALIFAACSNHTDIVKLLLNAGANVNAKSKNKETPLMFAAASANEEMVKILLEAGADVNAKNNKKCTSLMLIIKNNKLFTRSEFYMEDGDLILDLKVISSNIIKLLINAGANVNAKDKNGNTPLMFASIIKNSEIVNLLIKAGANVNDVNESGTTALIYAAARGDKKTVKLLLNNNADISIQDYSNDNALLRAKRCGNGQAARLLEKAEKAQNSNRQTT